MQKKSEYISPTNFDNSDMQASEQTYDVVKGDSLWSIAKKYNTTVDKLRDLNPNIKNDLILPGQKVVYNKKEAKAIYNLREDWNNQDEWNKNNISAIMHAPHQGNYVLVDKNNHRLSIFDKDNNLLFSTNNIATGESGNDYNTITKADLSEKMNMSTPAGISQITGLGEYHGAISFQRNRNYSLDASDAIASSIHIGNTSKSNSSNGCIRVGNKKTLADMAKFMGAGTMVYTLPSKSGSRFSLADGRLNFTADNPYGDDNPDNPKRFWDDYNVVTDKTYNPLLIKYNDKLPESERSTATIFAKSLVNNKKQLQQDLGISSDLYNKLANLALGIAQQESQFGESDRYKLKQYTPDALMNLIRGDSHRSRGITQIKLTGDNKELQNLYKKYGITEDTILNPDVAAKATMLRLYYMYANEGSHFVGANGKEVPRLDALLYKWIGRNSELINHTATPELNNYINNVKNYAKMFDLYSVR